MSLTSAFTTTKWMIDWVHSHTTNCRTNTEPSFATSFSKLSIHALFISNDTDCCIAFAMNSACFARRKSDDNIVAIFTLNCCTSTSRANKLTTTTECELEVMNSETCRDCLERERVFP